MRSFINVPFLFNTSLIIVLSMMAMTMAAEARPSWIKGSIEKIEKEVTSTHGDAQSERLVRGMSQVADFWRDEDGGPEEFEAFVLENFALDDETLEGMFSRFESILEKINGSIHGMSIEMRRQSDLDLGPVLPMDRVFAGYDPGAHIADDLFANKLAFVALLNFPVTSLEERLTDGTK